MYQIQKHIHMLTLKIDQVEREVGGGIGMGNTGKPMADSCQMFDKNHHNIVK